VLAPAKRPKEYALVPALPMTATGKVRRDALAGVAADARRLSS
jgi:long-chain acyl-CoA synthetase